MSGESSEGIGRDLRVPAALRGLPASTHPIILHSPRAPRGAFGPDVVSAGFPRNSLPGDYLVDGSVTIEPEPPRSGFVRSFGRRAPVSSGVSHRGCHLPRARGVVSTCSCVWTPRTLRPKI